MSVGDLFLWIHVTSGILSDANGTVKELVFPKALDLDRPKRARTTFSPEQLYHLEREFNRNQYLVGKERTELAKTLRLSETQVNYKHGTLFRPIIVSLKRDSVNSGWFIRTYCISFYEDQLCLVWVCGISSGSSWFAKVLYDFVVTVKAAPHKCVISTGQP